MPYSRVIERKGIGRRARPGGGMFIRVGTAFAGCKIRAKNFSAVAKKSFLLAICISKGGGKASIPLFLQAFSAFGPICTIRAKIQREKSA